MSDRPARVSRCGLGFRLIVMATEGWLARSDCRLA